MEKTIGQRIKAQRNKMHMTQEDLAEIMHVPKSTISAYENDKVDIKSSVIVELSKYLHTEPNYLLGYIESEKTDFDEYTNAIVNLINKITDKTLRELLFRQIKVATEIYNEKEKKIEMNDNL